MREALRSLTLRGRGFLAGGLTAVVCGILLGERDLARIGVLAAALPVLTAVWVARSGHRLGLRRTLGTRQVAVGRPVSVRLQLTNLGTTTNVLLVEEDLPYELGPRPRFVVSSMGTGWHREVEYTVRAQMRGCYPIGPLRVRAGDPFGLLEVQRVFRTTTDLVVTPVVVPLPPIRLRGAWSGGGDNRPRAFSSGSAADVTVREYRRGDDLRRVHWRSTARVGDLMVRREEQPWQSRCTLLVDNRARSHRGHGPASSLEAAVVAAASVAGHLTRQGYQVRLVSAAGVELGEAWHDGNTVGDIRPILERLAVLPAQVAPALNTDWVDDTVASGLFVAVLGVVDDHDRAFLSRIHSTGGSPYALVHDVAAWAAPDAPDAGPPATDWLHARGWRAATVSRRTPLAAAWQELSR